MSANLRFNTERDYDLRGKLQSAELIANADGAYVLFADHEREVAELRGLLEEKELMLGIRTIEVGSLEKEADGLQAELQLLRAENARLKQPVTAEENFHFERDLVMQTLTGAEHLRNNVQRHLSTMTSGEQWSLYRAIAKLVLASRSKEPEGEQR